MRRFATALALLAASLVFAGCVQLHALLHHAPEVYHAPPAAVAVLPRHDTTPPPVVLPDTVKAAPTDSVAYPVRYEQRPFVDHVLLFNRDGSYVIFRTKDSVITQHGAYTFHGDTLLMDDCVMHAKDFWLKGVCLSDGSIWRQVPHDPHWPPTPHRQPEVAFLPGASQTFDRLLNAH